MPAGKPTFGEVWAHSEDGLRIRLGVYGDGHFEVRDTQGRERGWWLTPLDVMDRYEFVSAPEEGDAP